MIKKSRFIIFYVLLIMVGLYINLHADVAVPVNKSFTEFPLAVQGWKMTSQAQFSESVLDVLKPSDYLSRSYVQSDGQDVQLYIGYHGGGKGTGGIHSPKHCLPGSGWYEESTKRITVNIGGSKINMVEAVYKKGENRELFLYWFQVRDASLSDEYSLKVSEIVNSMLYRRRDSSFVRISIPVKESLEQSRSAGVRFVQDFYPAIRQHLPI